MTTTKTKRTDPHRPGAIVPADYTYLFSYNLSTTVDGWPIPSFGVTCELDGRLTGYATASGEPCPHPQHSGSCREGCSFWVKNGSHREGGECCCVAVLALGRPVFGSPGKCGVCGARFVYGDVWKHTPSGAYVHLGHDCADKYSMLADRSAWELENGRAREAAAVAILKAQNAEQRAAFLAKHEGLETDLAADHPIVRDIAARFTQYRTLSDKQVALVRKIAAELRAPKAEPEAHVPAPTGRVTFRGVVVSAKMVESDYGVQVKVTVKVQAEGGTWLAWGTCPRQLLDDVTVPRDGTAIKALRGCEVEVTATLKPGRESHFALMGRPLGKILAQAVQA